MFSEPRTLAGHNASDMDKWLYFGGDADLPLLRLRYV